MLVITVQIYCYCTNRIRVSPLSIKLSEKLLPTACNGPEAASLRSLCGFSFEFRPLIVAGMIIPGQWKVRRDRLITRKRQEEVVCIISYLFKFIDDEFCILQTNVFTYCISFLILLYLHTLELDALYISFE